MTSECLIEPDRELDKRHRIAPHEAARLRMLRVEHGGVFRSDWLDAAFIHLNVDRHALARRTPFELDLFEDDAYVSLVAFHMSRFRVRGTGDIGALLMAPAARHGLLNVRTYVRHANEPGICFLTEWIPNPLSVFLGPRLFGLPYRFGRLRYRHRPRTGLIQGTAQTRDRRHQLQYEAAIDSAPHLHVATPGSLDEFLLERYTAFMDVGGRRRFFRIWHEPWHIASVKPVIHVNSLLARTAPWMMGAKVVGAHYSPGVRDVWIGRARHVEEP